MEGASAHPPRTRAALIALTVLTLSACTPAPTPTSPTTTRPTPDFAAPSGSASVSPAGAPPAPSGGDLSAPAPAAPDETIPRSPVTWEIIHTASAVRSPGGPLHLAPPYRFEINFSGPVDLASVEAALASNLGQGRLENLQWNNDQRLLLAVADLTPGEPQAQAAIDPTGGRDRSGRRLQLPDPQSFLAAFAFWPTPATAVVKLDPVTAETTTVAHLPQPYQTVSLSPDGRRLLLRQHILTPGQSVGTTGTAHLFDLEIKHVEDLEIGGLFRFAWSRDGGLLADGGCRPSAQCVTWVQPGPLAGGRGGTRRLLYMNQKDEYIASAHLSPDGRHAAVFAGPWGEPLDLHFFDLTPARAGRRLQTVPKAAGVTQGPSGLTWVPAAWTPDGSALAYGDGGTRREELEPMRVLLAAPSGGEHRLLAAGAMGIGPWRPQGDQLALPGVGVVDRSGQVLQPGGNEPVAWNPDGSRLFAAGSVLDSATMNTLWRSAAPGPAFWSPDGQALAILGATSAPLPDHADGGLFRADGTPITGRFLGPERAIFSPDGQRVYLSNPDRVVDLPTGRVYPITIALPPVPGLGAYRPIGFSPEGQLLLALGQPWEQ